MIEKETYLQWLYKDIDGLKEDDVQEYVKNKVAEISKTKDDEIVLQNETRFIGTNSPVITMFDSDRSDKIKSGFILDDIEIYATFLKQFLKEKPQSFKATLDFVDRFQIQILGDTSSSVRRKLEYGEVESFGQKNEQLNVAIMPFKDLTRLKISQCAEKSALVHNLLKLLGFETVRSECFISNKEGRPIQGGYHALNIVTVPDTLSSQGREMQREDAYAAIFDTTMRDGENATALPLGKKEQQEFIASGKPIKYAYSENCFINKDKPTTLQVQH